MRVPHRLRPRRSGLRALAAALAASAQFAVTAIAPIIEAQEGAGTPTHVESLGTRLHFSHNADTCAACVAQTLVGVATPAARPLASAEVVAPALTPAPPAFCARIAWRPESPRAPPAPPGAPASS
jgi:hypothetical protein